MSVAGLMAQSSSIGAAASGRLADGMTIGVSRGASSSEYDVAVISVSMRLAKLPMSAHSHEQFRCVLTPDIAVDKPYHLDP